jgi:hypothetical protein
MAIYFGQTITEKLSQANDYYAVDNHIRAYDWAQFSDNEKKAALNQSEREVNLYLGIDLEENYSTIDWPADWNKNFRPDYAIFEQALFILDETARTNTSTDGAQIIESEEYQEQERDVGVGLSPQATRFLSLNRIQLSRG